ncbi:response regulator [Desulfosarcina cetonica]|uniref:response regulator n=1 Tax=Desulfosarcina cetonica TaxID=90730 RepID=UPI0009F8405F|nr:response regulator [Desulfosarcina cetonica]
MSFKQVKGSPMKEQYRLLIADRNPRIRDYLKREFTTAGYIVYLAENGKQLIKLLYGPTHLDLLIVDPDFPDAEATVLSKKLQDRVPQLPVVLHTLDTELETGFPHLRRAKLIEKKGCSVESLKKAVVMLLAAQKTPPGG